MREGMPTHDELPREHLDGPARDARTGARPDEGVVPLTDEDRRLQRVRERERWVSAVSVPPPPRRARP